MTEQELINFLTEKIPRQSQGLLQGVDDDCAVIAGLGKDWLFTTDALFEGVHFKRAHTSFELLGRKSLQVNLSDVAAMGGRPLFYTVSLGVPQRVSEEQLKQLYKGMLSAGRSSNVVMVGGDTCRSSSGLVICLSLLGEVAKGRAVLRRGAVAGDHIYVTGKLGDAGLGLLCLEKGVTKGTAGKFIERFNNPQARLQAGSWLADTGLVTAMIDISDGLLADLGHIGDASGTGFRLLSAAIPLAEGFSELCRELGADPLELALTSGEDYELAFSVAQDKVQEFEKMMASRDFSCPITMVGKISSDPKERIVLGDDHKPIEFSKKGYDHFAK